METLVEGRRMGDKVTVEGNLTRRGVVEQLQVEE